MATVVPSTLLEPLAHATPASVTPDRTHPLRTASTIVFAALLLTWPALYNGYPLLYPDTISYLQDGGATARAIFLHQLAGFSAMRSEIYSLGIFPFHWNLTPWPIVALNALLTAWVLWLVVRSTVPRPNRSPASRAVPVYLAVVVFLSLLTSASWYVSLLMPDILGALLYLAIYLLVFARDTISRAECWALSALAVWAIAAHATHLMLAAGLCLLLGLLLLVRWRPIAGRGRALAHIAGLVALAAAAQLALHTYLYGHPSLNGNHPPYLMARIIADGPGVTYLRQHCATLDWAICADVDHLPDNDDDFLWGDTGIWTLADANKQQRLLAEEMPLVLATLRAYPRQQAAVSFSNFTHQLDDFGVNDFDNNDWMQAALYDAIPSSRAVYPRTLEARSILPTNRFTILQRWVMFPCAVLLAALLPWLRSHHRHRLLGLVAIVVPVLLANAFVTAVLSSSDSRYQARIIWLIALAAALAAVDGLSSRKPDLADQTTSA